MAESGALFWLLNLEAYDFDVGVLRDTEIKGMLMIVSRQLWSIIRGDRVVSALIGPGLFKGVAERNGRRVELSEQLSALIFDPTALRYDEPIPLVDIVQPEIIDPLASSNPEEIYSVIRKLIFESGNILAVDPLIKVSQSTSVPKTIHYSESLEKIKITHVSGVQRAKFILAGTNSPLYKPFLEFYNRGRYRGVQLSRVMAVHDSKFSHIEDEETMKEWTIVEKFGISENTGKAAFEEEYYTTLEIISRNEDAFIFND